MRGTSKTRKNVLKIDKSDKSDPSALLTRTQKNLVQSPSLYQVLPKTYPFTRIQVTYHAIVAPHLDWAMPKCMRITTVASSNDILSFGRTIGWLPLAAVTTSLKYWVCHHTSHTSSPRTRMSRQNQRP